MGALAITAGAASAAVVYKNLPPLSVKDTGSQCLAGCGVTSFGGVVGLGGKDRHITEVIAEVSSFSCQYGIYSNDSCETVKKAQYSEQVTLKIYAPKVGEENEPGALLDESTVSALVPYKPSPNVTGCPLTSEGRGWGSECHIGDLAKVRFAGLSAFAEEKKVVLEVELPQDGQATDVNKSGDPNIVNVATNNPYNGLTETFEGGPAPSKGFDPYPSEAVINGASETGWTGFQPAFEVQAAAA